MDLDHYAGKMDQLIARAPKTAGIDSPNIPDDPRMSWSGAILDDNGRLKTENYKDLFEKV